ncbi:CIC11C00000004862 [Sungouiella intermedia]|uniref:CIC11C00000004862 n=1 Tax=Sungouiella intermedia TaxID=45354 RepID=A0A1L0C110_9ASCO|nr:CIC11C00000004862 [[Candida] intermedia]
MDAASVRVNSTTLREFAGRIVRVVGKVESFDGASELARLNAGGPVDVLVPPGSHLEEGKIYEIIGKASVSDFKSMLIPRWKSPTTQTLMLPTSWPLMSRKCLSSSILRDLDIHDCFMTI